MTGLQEGLEVMNVWRSGWYLSVAAIVALGLCGAVFAQTPAAGCKKDGQSYACNWEAFQARLKQSNTVAVRAEHLDAYTGVQLQHLAAALGKTVVEKDADLGFEVVPVDSNGVRIGPSDEALAQLRIYAKGFMSSRWEPVWVETYTGQADMPWASTVHETIQQFEDRLPKTTR